MVHLYPHREEKYAKDRKSIVITKTLSFLCLNAGIGFNQIAKMNPRSIILTSGTLSPMDTFSAELQVQFPVQLINKHVIDRNQVEMQVIKKDSSNKEFQFSYAKTTDEMLEGLGESIR